MQNNNVSVGDLVTSRTSDVFHARVTSVRIKNRYSSTQEHGHYVRELHTGETAFLPESQIVKL